MNKFVELQKIISLKEIKCINVNLIPNKLCKKIIISNNYKALLELLELYNLIEVKKRIIHSSIIFSIGNNVPYMLNLLLKHSLTYSTLDQCIYPWYEKALIQAIRCKSITLLKILYEIPSLHEYNEHNLMYFAITTNKIKVIRFLLDKKYKFDHKQALKLAIEQPPRIFNLLHNKIEWKQHSHCILDTMNKYRRFYHLSKIYQDKSIRTYIRTLSKKNSTYRRFKKIDDQEQKRILLLLKHTKQIPSLVTKFNILPFIIRQ
jgi:hypothetical protein